MSSPSRLAAMLHRDAVHSIFAFLSLRDLASAASTCAEWRSCVQSAPAQSCGSITVHHGNCEWLWRDLMQSAAEADSHGGRLARHLGTLRVVPLRPIVALLQSLRVLPGLTRLKCAWGTTPLPALLALSANLAAYSLPSKLVELHVDVRERPTIREQAAMFDISIALAARCCSRLRKLVLTCSRDQGASLRFDVTPLCALTELEEATFEVQPSIELVQALGAIRTLKIIAFPSSEPVADPVPFLEGHSIHALQRLQIRSQPLHGAQLTRLALLVPTLTALPQCDLFWSAVPALQLFPRLTSLQLSRAEVQDDADALDARASVKGEDFVPLLLGCSCLPKLTRLSFACVDDLSNDLAERLFSRLCAVRILELELVRLSSLSWLRHVPCVEQLSIASCSLGLAQADLQYVESLPALLHLHVMEDDYKLLMPADVTRLSVPSAALPHLLCFHYSNVTVEVETPSFCRRTLPLQLQSFEEPVHCVL